MWETGGFRRDHRPQFEDQFDRLQWISTRSDVMLSSVRPFVIDGGT